jgi:hypothetical protein
MYVGKYGLQGKSKSFLFDFLFVHSRLARLDQRTERNIPREAE